MTTAIHWFRRDLRLEDNPVFAETAASCSRLLPVYIDDDPVEAGAWPEGAASRWWLYRSLQSLDSDLRARGSSLCYLRGSASMLLPRLAAATAAGRVSANRRLEPAARDNQTRVAEALAARGCRLDLGHAGLLIPPEQATKADGSPYRLFTPFWKARLRAGFDQRFTPAPRTLPPLPAAAPSSALSAPGEEEWQVKLARHWSPGEAGAQRRIADFLELALAAYPADRDRPAREGTSRLSPHLHFGELGPRQVVAAVESWAAATEGGWAAAESFLRQLLWREFANHLLHHYPQTPEQPLNRRFDSFRWAGDYDRSLEHWRRGQTGIPLVDAGMRELWETGWMHNRVRMVTASFLTKNLLVPWQEGARWFWDTLVDADLANNSFGWQWVAGTGADAAPYFRVFNAVRQGERFDPEGRYVARWVPELAGLDRRQIHRPWAAKRPIGAYPRPMVDLGTSGQRALARFRELRPAMR